MQPERDQFVLYHTEDIQKATKRMALEIDEFIQSSASRPILICILGGAFMFMADLCRAITVPHDVDFMKVSSYEGTTSTGHVTMKLDCTMDLADRDVILVEDIVDTGTTMHHLIDLLKTRNPKSVSIATLLSKPSKLRHDLGNHLRFIGYEIDDVFVYGYGMDDADGGNRHLSEILKK